MCVRGGASPSTMNLIHSVLVVPTCWARMLLVRVGYVSLLVLVPALLNEHSVVEAFAQPCEEGLFLDLWPLSHFSVLLIVFRLCVN